MWHMAYANNKGADQPAYSRSLNSTFVVRCLEYDMYTCYIQSFKILASFCSWAGWFECYLVANSRRHIFAWWGPLKYGNVWKTYWWKYNLFRLTGTDTSETHRIKILIDRKRWMLVKMPPKSSSVPHTVTIKVSHMRIFKNLICRYRK